MSYQTTNREVTNSVFIQHRQMGYASSAYRYTTDQFTHLLPLNYTRVSGCCVSLGLG
jgi:hypothetical protein